MSKGRKPVPTHLKVLKGTLRPSRVNENEPTPSSERPTPPSWLGKSARGYFDLVLERLEEMGVASASHTESLVSVALRLEEVEDLTDLIKREGRVVDTETQQGGVMKRSHPAVGQRNEALRHLQSLLSDFGLTPASVSKVSVPGRRKEGNPFAQLG